MKSENNKKNRSGVALILAVTIVIILFLIGIGLIQLGRNARLQAVRDVVVISARTAADAGIEHAVRYMIDSWNTAANKPDWLSQWNDPAGNELKVTYPASSYLPMGDTFGNSEFQYKIYKGIKSNGYRVVSTGRAAGRTRIVHAAVVLRSVFFGVGAKRDIYISTGMILGTVPDNDMFIVQTNSIEDNAITLKPGLTIPGDVICGPGGDVATAIDFAPNVTIVPPGESKAASDYIDFPPVYPPEELLSLPFSGPRIDVNDPHIAYIDGNIKLDELQFGTGLLTDVETLYIEGDVKIFVDGFTYLSPGIQLIVTKDSSLVLYLGGNMDVKPGSDIIYGDTPHITDDEIIEAAKAISIKGTVAPDGTPYCTEIQFFPNGDFYGTIYAPDADPLYIAPNGDFYGAIVGADNITLKPGGTFMFIPSLVDIEDVEVLHMGIKHGSWWEE